MTRSNLGRIGLICLTGHGYNPSWSEASAAAQVGQEPGDRSSRKQRAQRSAVYWLAQATFFYNPGQYAKRGAAYIGVSCLA